MASRKSESREKPLKNKKLKEIRENKLADLERKVDEFNTRGERNFPTHKKSGRP
jgi:hypothetical protein